MKRWSLGVCDDCALTFWVNERGQLGCDGCEPAKAWYHVTPGTGLLEAEAQ